MTSKQRRIDIDTTLFQGCAPAGLDLLQITIYLRPGRLMLSLSFHLSLHLSTCLQVSIIQRMNQIPMTALLR